MSPCNLIIFFLVVCGSVSLHAQVTIPEDGFVTSFRVQNQWHVAPSGRAGTFETGLLWGNLGLSQRLAEGGVVFEMAGQSPTERDYLFLPFGFYRAHFWVESESPWKVGWDWDPWGLLIQNSWGELPIHNHAVSLSWRSGILPTHEAMLEKVWRGELWRASLRLSSGEYGGVREQGLKKDIVGLLGWDHPLSRNQIWQTHVYLRWGEFDHVEFPGNRRWRWGLITHLRGEERWAGLSYLRHETGWDGLIRYQSDSLFPFRPFFNLSPNSGQATFSGFLLESWVGNQLGHRSQIQYRYHLAILDETLGVRSGIEEHLLALSSKSGPIKPGLLLAYRTLGSSLQYDEEFSLGVTFVYQWEDSVGNSH